jgi:hypothetical protein
MTTRFRTAVSLAILGALALTAGAYAKEGNVGEMVRAARDGNGQREGNARQAPERRAERAVERAAERSPERSAARAPAQRQAPAPQVQRERPRDADGGSRQYQRFADRLPRNAPQQQSSPASPPVLAAAPQQQDGRDRGARNGGGDRGSPGSINRGERNERGTVGNVVRDANRNAQNRDRGNWNGGNGNWNRGDNDGRRYQGNRRPPRFVNTLPGGYRQYHWNGRPYYHYGGSWYRPYGSRYVVVGAPYGLFVSYLPSYYNTFWFGSTRYYYADDTYYVYEPARRGYVVTRSPYATEAEDEDYYDAELDQDLYIYPTRGQSEQQQADDRYECHAWAVDQTGYDPIESDYDADQRADYLRAMTACLTGRGYSVK